jgi:SAM-dependent methyltransferase
MSRDKHEAHDASPWVVRFASLIPRTGPVLDVASGTGRHARWLLDRGHDVVAIDRDVSGLDDIREYDQLEVVEVDLENGEPFPLGERRFAGVIVTNYLYRPILDQLVSEVASSGVLICETFAVGNDRFGRPRQPQFLLRPGELLDVVRGELRVVAFEDLVVDYPRPASVQRIAAVRDRENAR